MENINSELNQRANQQTAHTLDNTSTTQNSIVQHIDPKQAAAEVASATYKMVQGDGTIVWESTNYYYTLPPHSSTIFAGTKSQNLNDINVLNPGKWIPIGVKPAMQVELIKLYYQKNPPSRKEKNVLLPTGVTQVQADERNFLMLAVRLSIIGKTTETPITLAEKMRKWNPPVQEPFLSYKDINIYYEDPRTVQTQKLPHNNYQKHAIGHKGQVGSLSENRKMPQRTYSIETAEKDEFFGNPMPWNKTVDVIDPNVYVDDSPYKHAVAKEKIEQSPGPYDNTLSRSIEFITSFGGGNGNIIKGRNTLQAGRAKLPNLTQNNAVAKPRGEQYPVNDPKVYKLKNIENAKEPKYNSMLSRKHVKPKIEQREITIDWAEVARHSNEGDFPVNPNPKLPPNRTLKGGAHGYEGKQKMERINMTYYVLHKYSNGVEIGYVPGHKSKLKREGTGQSWFPDSWTNDDIIEAGKHVLKMNPDWQSIPDGVQFYAVFKGVRVGIMKTNGLPATVFPDGNFQPTAADPNVYEFNPY